MRAVNSNNPNTMGKNVNKRELYRQRREKEQEKQAKSVIRWICVVLFVLFIAIFGYFAAVG